MTFLCFYAPSNTKKLDKYMTCALRKVYDIIHELAISFEGTNMKTFTIYRQMNMYNI